MNNYSKMYWLTRLDYLQGFFIWGSVVLGILLLASIIINLDDNENAFLQGKSTRPLLIFLFTTSILFSCLIPTKNDMILIWAAGKTMDYVQTDSSLTKLPYQTTQIISQYLDKQIKDLKDKK